ncbi:MAG: hypothetical protein JWP11_1885 [Frankiales bacterium]|jgi:hypothetical protein|nr:hypothetical protein [Frankiales bacterium]
MDTLEVAVPRSRAYGLLAFAAVLVVVAALSDSAGRLLAAPAAVAVLALAVRDLRSGPVLAAGPQGVEVLQGLRRTRVPWPQVERMRVVKDRRTEMLELDLGSTLALLSRNRLGRLPEDVLTDLLAIRATVSRDSGGSGRPEPG